MHKKIKYIIAATLVIGTVSGFLPENNFILGSIEAHAATYNSASNGELNSLTLTRSTGSEIQFGDTYGSDQSSLTENKDYYVDLTGADGLQISAGVQGNGYVVKQFTSGSKTEQGQDVGTYIKVDSTYADIYLRTYKSEAAYEEAYGNGDVTDCEATYILHVKKPVVISDEEAFAQHAYLSSIYLSNGSIDFSKEQMSYNVNVNDNVEELLVRATPEDKDYSVSINDYSVDEDNNYEQTIKLDKGNNTIKIDVESDDEKKTYTLNVYRGNAETSTNSSSQTSTSQSSSTAASSVGTFNSWQRIDGKWKYIDGTGEPLKNQWWFDKNTGKNYYLREDGTMATGWLNNNNNWYYFSTSGEMQTGWICLDKNWYYLNKSGVMQMGWLEDSTGNWYYLDNSGAMKTGWLENSDGKWYYLDSTGKMIKNTVINGYQIDANGVLVN
ncbi:cadherin-like beta sandwich domain-containing protein [Clostridium sp.]|uniref:cadherin-like beta sandwich domain-containing protein n=1 Tax=Clostridium sp. TaxID=1506 RepID=UPI0026389D9A|nr:cadherin-like beta sandwich domain-containing protein [Clostridium sp.]